MVPGACHDGVEAGMGPPEEAGEAEAPIAPGEALVESVPALIDVAMAQTSELELLASSTIGGSTPKGALVTEEVPSAPVGPTPMVATVDPSARAGPSWSLV